MMTEPVIDTTGMPRYTEIDQVLGELKAVGTNTGFNRIWDSLDEKYRYRFEDAHPLMPRWYSVTAYDYGDPHSGTPELESSRMTSAIFIAPSGSKDRHPMVCPNPYRADRNYTYMHGDGLAWENRDDGTQEFFRRSTAGFTSIIFQMNA